MGKSLNYPSLIKESAETLESLLKSQSESLQRDRLRYLLVLKRGDCKTQGCASAHINVSTRQGQRNWSLYMKKGLKGLLDVPVGGAPCKLEESEQLELKKRLEDDDIQFLHEVAAYIKKEYKKSYTPSGIHYLFKRLKVKKKTGRPVNIRQDKKELEEFKKTLKN